MIRPLRSILACLLIGLLTVAFAVAPSGASAVERRAPLTELTLVMPECEGCEITMASYNGGLVDDWVSESELVTDGEVLIVVPSVETAGLSIQVRAPWDGFIGYTTNVVFRYSGQAIGSKVGFKAARSKKWASGCWAGTVNDAVKLRVKTRSVRVRGVQGKARGTIAWIPRTESYLKPVARAYKGVLGGQGVMECQS